VIPAKLNTMSSSSKSANAIVSRLKRSHISGFAKPAQPGLNRNHDENAALNCRNRVKQISPRDDLISKNRRARMLENENLGGFR
jgi:hypothetical protein